MIDKHTVPAHIAIIMDGNGRWARTHGVPKIMGHKKGVETVRVILRACGEIGIKYLTLYTFSTENWQRPRKEVDAIMKLLAAQLERETKNLDKNNVRLNAIGRLKDFPDSIKKRLNRSIEFLSKNTGVVLTLALGYGGRSEIVDAVKSIVGRAQKGEIKESDISENTFGNYLYTNTMPDPDLLIRTSGEMRISNFLLWQISYSEIYLTKKLWPDFKRKDLEEAIEDFQGRQRRYGK